MASAQDDFDIAIRYVRTLCQSHRNTFHLNNEQLAELEKGLDEVQKAHDQAVADATAAQQMKPAKA